MSIARDNAVKKKHVRFASMEDDEDNDDQEEDTLFDKRNDTLGGLKSALKAVSRAKKPVYDMVEVLGAGSGAGGACSRWMVTLTLCASFLGLGMSISVVGPTFEDLASNLQKNISNISYVFVGRSAGYIAGSLLGGILFDWFSMLVTAFGMSAVPFCKRALLLTGLMSSIGISMGILDTGGNVLILKTWGDRAGPYMQALHFSFAVGAFVSPILAKLMFLADSPVPLDPVAHLPNATSPLLTAPVVTLHMAATSSLSHPTMHYMAVKTSSLHSMWAYIFIAGFVLLTSLFFFILYCCGGTAHHKTQATPSGAPPRAKHHVALILLLSVFFFWYVGTEVAYGAFIFTYAKDYAGMDARQAAGLNALFWGAFAACRGLAIFFAACLYPGTLILLSLVGSTLSSLLLCLFNRHQVALWLCTGFYGASMATTFPSGISWVEQYTAVTGRAAAGFVVGAALGEMVLPAVLGFLLGSWSDQPLLMYLALLAATITSIIFPVMYKLGGKPRSKARHYAEDSEYRQALLDSAANDEEEEEADQWNNADFEVIEMDDAPSLENLPVKGSPPPTAMDLTGASSPAPAAKATEPAGAGPFSDMLSLVADSPRRKKLLSLVREKRD